MPANPQNLSARDQKPQSGTGAAEGELLPPARPLVVDDVVGHYRILGHLGAGGMGTVYRALDLQLKREVAIKVALAPTTLEMDAMLREARLLATLNHPNVVTIYEASQHQGSAYLVMELLRGETLRAHMDRGRPTLTQALAWICDVLRGLSAAHNAHIEHLDVKPENVFLTTDGQLKLIDFGIARQRRSGIQSQSAVIGTIAYMAPEQLLGQNTNFRADLFSVGTILHELVTGQHPFAKEHAGATMMALVQGDYFLHGTASDPQIEAIIRACMDRQPELRPPSAAHVLEQLEQILHERTASMPRSEVLHVETEHGNVAFQCVGTAGGIDVLAIPGLLSRFDAWSQVPEGIAFMREIAQAGRIVLYDRAGLGASDRIADSALPFPDEEIAHVDAIIEALGVPNVVLFAMGTGAPLAALYAAFRSERVAGLVLYAGAPNYSEPEMRERLAKRAEGWGTKQNVSLCAPSYQADERLAQWYASLERGAASSKTARAWATMMGRVNVTALLPFIACPTLVVRRQDDSFSLELASNIFAKRIQHAALVTLPGSDHLPCAGDTALASQVCRFARGCAAPSRVTEPTLATWLYSDASPQSIPPQIRPHVVHGSHPPYLMRIDRPGLALRALRASFARASSQTKAVIACSRPNQNPADLIAEMEPLLRQARPGTIVTTPLAREIIEGTAGISVASSAQSNSDASNGQRQGGLPSLEDMAPLVHKSFSIKVEPGAIVRVEGSIMLKDPQRQLVPHFRRIHEAARGLDKLVIDVRRLSQINSSGLGIFIGWVGWIQSEGGMDRYRLQILIDPKVLWQRANLMPLAMIAPEVIEVIHDTPT